MSEPKLYPVEKTILVEPIRQECSLQFKLDGFDQVITKDQCILKLALPAKGKFSNPEHQARVKQILATMLDAQHFELTNESGQICLSVPIRMLPHNIANRNLRIKLPILVKLDCSLNPPISLKCIQELDVQIVVPPEE